MATINQWDYKVVVECMINALESSHPPAQLLIGADAKYGLVVLRMFPAWVRHYIAQMLMPSQERAQ
jgi:hypothetical protein